MKYYVVADVHGFYSSLIDSLKEKGYFVDKEPHKLIVCGDLFDRGEEAIKLQQFIVDLINKDEIILIRGNHEDLLLAMMNEWNKKSYLQNHHKSNGTLSTVFQITGCNSLDLLRKPDEVYRKLKETDFYKTIIPKMQNYFETNKFIFVHGWIPCEVVRINRYAQNYFQISDWRNADNEAWNYARWINGMQAAKSGVIEKDKTIVCGHWNCSYGHFYYEGKGSEYDSDADYSPYFSNGIIAIDACTTVSKKVNCLIVED